MVVIGDSAAENSSNSGTSASVVIGAQCAVNQMTISSSVIIGAQTGLDSSNTTSNRNTCVGYRAGRKAYMQNVFIGGNAGWGSSNNPFYVTAVGDTAGYSAQGTNYLTAIGYQSAYFNSTGANNCAIGARSNLMLNTG